MNDQELKPTTLQQLPRTMRPGNKATTNYKLPLKRGSVVGVVADRGVVGV